MHVNHSSEPDRADERLTTDDLTTIRRSLEREIERLRRSSEWSDSIVPRQLRDDVEDAADTSERIAERGCATVLTANSSTILAECRAAMDRLDAGVYGRCEACGDTIGRARLLAFPRARLCLGCQRRHETTARLSGAIR